MKILIDIDGVLINSKQDVYECYKEAFKQVAGIPLSMGVFECAIWDHTWKEATLKLELTQADAIHKMKNDLDIAKILQFDPCLAEFTQILAGSAEVLFVSAGSNEASLKKLQTLTGYTDVPILAEANKSDPRFWDWMNENYGGPFMLIDDSELNCIVAKAKGVTTIHWRIV